MVKAVREKVESVVASRFVEEAEDVHSNPDRPDDSGRIR
jgi:hypothetical protein